MRRAVVVIRSKELGVARHLFREALEVNADATELVPQGLVEIGAVDEDRYAAGQCGFPFHKEGMPLRASPPHLDKCTT